MTKTVARSSQSLFRTRDYALLWAGQTLSLIGSQSSWVAYPLLVLALTGSAARAGIVSAASWLPYLILQLPAGALADRWNRKWTMAVCDAVRAVAVASIPFALAVDVLTYSQLVAVAFVERAMSILFEPSETAALSRIVNADQISEAIARNNARENTAGMIGPPLGGALFGLARMAPFALNAASYLISLVTVLALRTPLAAEHRQEKRRMRVEVAEGVRFIWRIPFLRATALQAMGTNVTWSAMILAIIVVARRNGASGGEVGVMLALVGAGGVAGSAFSGPLLRRLAPPLIVLGAVWCWAALVALLVVSANPFFLGAIGGLALSLGPAWNGAVVGLRIRITPDRLQGRVHAVEALLSFGARPLAMLAVGFLLDGTGGRSTLAIIAAWTAAVALVSTAAPSLRRTPAVVDGTEAANGVLLPETRGGDGSGPSVADATTYTAEHSPQQRHSQ
jgi:MFS family permease